MSKGCSLLRKIIISFKDEEKHSFYPFEKVISEIKHDFFNNVFLLFSYRDQVITILSPHPFFDDFWERDSVKLGRYDRNCFTRLLISFQTFFVWALLLIVHTWNSNPLRSNFLRLQCTCSTVPTTSGRPHGTPLVWACQWPSSQPLSSPQLSHNNSLWT